MRSFRCVERRVSHTCQSTFCAWERVTLSSAGSSSIILVRIRLLFTGSSYSLYRRNCPTTYKSTQPRLPFQSSHNTMCLEKMLAGLFEFLSGGCEIFCQIRPRYEVVTSISKVNTSEGGVAIHKEKWEKAWKRRFLELSRMIHDFNLCSFNVPDQFLWDCIILTLKFETDWIWKIYLFLGRLDRLD